MKGVRSDSCKVFFKGVELEPLVGYKMEEKDFDGKKKRTLWNEHDVEVGHIVYGIDRGHCEIVFLYVEEKYRKTKSGYAKELMRSILADSSLVEVRLNPKPSRNNGEVIYLNENDLRGFYKSFRFGIEGKNDIVFGT